MILARIYLLVEHDSVTIHNFHLKMIVENPEIRCALKYQEFVLKFFGIWPQKQKKWWQKFNTIASYVLAFATISLNLIEILLNIFDFIILAKVLYMTLSFTSYLFKQSSFMYHKDVFNRLLHMMTIREFQESKSSTNITKNMISTIHMFSKVYISGCICVFFLYAFYPLIDGTALPTDLSYVTYKYRPFVYVLQVANLFYSANNNMSFDVLIPGLMAVSASQFDLLKENIKSIREEAVEKVMRRWHCKEEDFNDVISEEVDLYVEKRLKECVEHHNLIKKYAFYLHLHIDYLMYSKSFR